MIKFLAKEEQHFHDQVTEEKNNQDETTSEEFNKEVELEKLGKNLRKQFRNARNKNAA